MTLLQTLRLIKSDYVRMATHYRFKLTPTRAMGITILPPMMAMILYRLSHYFVLNGMGFFGWPLYSLNVMVTGADIGPRSVIGPSCLLGHAPGTIITGHIGKNATLLARAGIGGGRKMDDIGAGPGLPIVGDDVTVCANASIMGSIRIGDGAIIGASAVVMKDVPAGATVAGNPARVVRLNSPGLFDGLDEVLARPTPSPGPKMQVRLPEHSTSEVG